ncbi:Ger(x)C family spore germination protein [Paenibacillus sambharensis]|uniref:Ger(X)C family spore germination protein n=1 Tax=Paenibacillus sambharensis TaxID=1803190 RepID=A0A2W1LAB4_9BACL|nr:Ger(x)C family spore germination protein [Paenibacillus sambharensis]PZD97188.1 Ger(x)C family spore germination protein [Paenibacillus sambharensis]
MTTLRVWQVMTLLLVCSLLLSGCGQRQLNELGLVAAVGLDPGKEPGSVRLTAQIVRPADARGQTGAPTGGVGEPIYSVSAEGRTIFEAIRNMARYSTRRVYWAHNYLIVMNEDYAKAGVTDMVDFFTRNHELRMNTWVAVTPDNASEVVSTITGLEVVPGEAIDKLMRFSEIVAEAPRTNIMRLQEMHLTPHTQIVLAKLQLKKRGIPNKSPEKGATLKQLELSGAAVFREDKMEGWLSPKESNAMLLFLQDIKSGVIVQPCPDEENRYITLEVRQQRVQVKPEMKEGEPTFSVSVSTQASMVELGCRASYAELRPSLEKQLADEIKLS